ncbi:expressed unknown protein [Seminavis robusta]|uniref:Uncharacterized protein n=1 Tax=Seminavis robusta TaxID=568900 RepID=A0A9N8EE24_9STRA|nr:expressed unknown protein [Seminavis robusta]|eukprot:Sro806_g205080.1 n/a (440) ;mRNA; f:14793-16112
MKLSLLATTLTTLLVSSVSAAPKGEHGPIDTTRGPKLFEPPRARRGGYTYVDEFSIKVNGEMDSAAGMAIKGTLDATADTKTVVTSLEGGKMKLDMLLENVKGSVQSFMMTVNCDSNDRAHSDPQCAPLFDVVGAEETMVVDEEGNIYEITTPDGQTLEMVPPPVEAEPEQVLMHQETLAGKFRANQFAASHHLDKSHQLLKLIPDHAVRPGDSWIDDVDMEGMGTFKGNSVLMGYTTYEDRDCAVFEFEGTLHIDVTQLAGILGVDDPSLLPSNMTDAEISNVIIWDYEDDISRWAQVNITTSFDMPNILNPVDPKPVQVPVSVVLSLNTDITVRPDHEEEQQSSSSGMEYRGYNEASQAKEKSGEYQDSSSFSSNSGGKKKSGGWGKTFFFLFMLAGVGAAGYVYYKKREGDDFFVRPTYEFSPVGAEPIYNSNGFI